MRGLLIGSGLARAADDMAALVWQLGAGAGAVTAGGSAARDEAGDDNGFGFAATAASPLANMLTEARRAPHACPVPQSALG